MLKYAYEVSEVSKTSMKFSRTTLFLIASDEIFILVTIILLLLFLLSDDSDAELLFLYCCNTAVLRIDIIN
jgi:hypothetical protein